MYESFYNFKAEPFRLSPDHRFCFSHKSYAKAKAYMQYAIHRAEGFVMVTGKPGTGKTTLVNDLVEGLSHSKIVVATIVSTQLEADDLLRLVACSFGLDIDAPNKAVVLQGLSVRLRRHHEEGTRALLIIDEAQDLSASALEELRLLTNLQLNNQPLLQIFLVGQENLRDLVQKPSMEQVHQRLVAACHLESLNEEDTKAYIKHRLDRVGWKDDPSIDEGVYTVAYQFSKGIPRRINLVCSRFLLHGSVEEKHRIRASDVRTVVQELQHEQLTPIGFKAEMPPLNDEDDLDDETQSESVAAPREQKATESSINALAAEVVGGSSRDDQDVSLKDTSTAPIDNKHEITKKSEESETLDEKTNKSLEALVNSEKESASSSATLDSADVIQENYFSLGGSLDAPSEPVPIRPLEKVQTKEYGYGDRFANAQRKKEQSKTTTHYYNEYQVSRQAATLKRKKSGMFTKLFLFLLVISVIFTAIYVVRPQMLQSQISYLESRVGQYVQQLKERFYGASDSSHIDEVIKKNEQLSSDNSETPVQSVISHADSSPPGTNKIEVEVVQATVSSQQTKPQIDEGSISGQDQEESEKIVPDSSQIQLPYTNAIESKIETLSDQETIKTPNFTGQQTESIKSANTVNDKAPVEVAEGASAGKLDGQISAITDRANARVAAVSSTQFGSREKSDMGMGNKNSLIQDFPQQQDTKNKKADISISKMQVLFSSDSARIEPEYFEKLNKMVVFLKKTETDKARITGYADGSGELTYNEKLSLMRATAVADYFQKNDIPSQRLVVEGHGVLPLPDDSVGSHHTAMKMQRMVEIIIRPSVN